MAETPLEIVLAQLVRGADPDGDFADWDELDGRAREYRVQPLLHSRHAANRLIPDDLRERWAEAYRTSAIHMLHRRRELARLASLLRAHGLPVLALKGAYLAWHAWPDPALRPLRDLDLYLPGDAAIAAREILLEQGWRDIREEGVDQLGPEGWLARFKALPALASPDGIVVDLHARIWDEGGVSPPVPEGVMDRAVRDPDIGDVAFPCPTDQLMHLAIHAAHHRFDSGPLMLCDFAYTVAGVKFDWPDLWRRAEREGWQRHLSFCLGAARRWSGVDAAWPDLPATPPADVIERLPMLFAKPLATRDSDRTAAKLASRDQGMVNKLDRVWARRERHSTFLGYLGWIGREVSSLLRNTPSASDRIGVIGAIDDWLAR